MHKRFITFSLGLKFIFLIALIISVMMYFVNQLNSAQMEHSLRTEIIKRGESVANNLAILAVEALSEKPIDILTLSATVKQIEADDVDIVEVFLIDQDHRILAHNDFDKTDKIYEPALAINLDPNMLVQSYTDDRGTEFLFFTAPAQLNSELLATVHVVASTEKIFETIDQLRRKNQIMALIGAALAIILTFVVVTVLIAPIKDLMRGVDRIGQGDYGQHVTLRYHDEIGQLTEAFNEMAINLKEKEILKQALKSYIPSEILDKIKENPDMLTPGGASKYLTIIFTDIRGFTRLSEGASPTQVVEMLNEHLKAVSDIIIAHGGWVDKFMGDAVMAFFGAPIAREDDNLRAVRAAYEIQIAINQMSAVREKEGKPPVRIGIGINSGEAHVGIIGTRDKMDYTVIGDTVNVSQRLESIAKPGQILISSRVATAIVHQAFELKSLPAVKVKGKEEAVEIFEVLAKKP